MERYLITKKEYTQMQVFLMITKFQIENGLYFLDVFLSQARRNGEGSNVKLTLVYARDFK